MALSETVAPPAPIVAVKSAPVSTASNVPVIIPPAPPPPPILAAPPPPPAITKYAMSLGVPPAPEPNPKT